MPAQLLVTLRPGFPWNDDSDASYSSTTSGLISTPPAPYSEPFALYADKLGSTPSLGDITHVVLALRVKIALPGPEISIVNPRIVVTQSGSVGSYVPTGPLPQPTTYIFGDVVIALDAWGWIQTAELGLAPDGHEWNWGKVNALTSPGLSGTWFTDQQPVGPVQASAGLAEARAYVYGIPRVEVLEPHSPYFQYEIRERMGLRV